MLSSKCNFIFIHVPKTGGNSVHLALREYSEDQLTANAHQDLVNRFGVCGRITESKHFSIADYISKLGIEAVQKMYTFACVRNPFDRAMSYYFTPYRWHRLDGGKSVKVAPVFDKRHFLLFLQQEFAPMTNFLAYQKSIFPFTKIMRFETLQEDFKIVTTNLSLPTSVQLPHVNQSGVHSYRHFYDDETANAVAKLCRQDFEIFNYPIEFTY